jgi:23S rRNA pseudouridine1911/1915/1917 synthase
MNKNPDSPEVIYTDPDFIVVSKPAHLLVHAIKGQHAVGPTLADWLLARYPELKTVGDDPANRPGIVHRLDRDTSGVLIIPRTQGFFSYIKKLFQSHEVSKEYLALVWGHLRDDAGTVALPIGIRAGSVKRTTHIRNARLIKDAVTDYRVQKRLVLKGEPVTLVSLFPKTGRTHQLRVHLASRGYPVVGDMLYGGKTIFLKSTQLGITRHFLHAEAIEFVLPSSTRLKVQSPLPPDLSRVLAEARSDEAETPQRN